VGVTTRRPPFPPPHSLVCESLLQLVRGEGRDVSEGRDEMCPHILQYVSPYSLIRSGGPDPRPLRGAETGL